MLSAFQPLHYQEWLYIHYIPLILRVTPKFASGWSCKWRKEEVQYCLPKEEGKKKPKTGKTIPKDSLSSLHNSFIEIRVLREGLFFVLLNQSSINLSHNYNASPMDNYNQTHSRQLIKWQNTQIYFLISTHCCFQQYKDNY